MPDELPQIKERLDALEKCFRDIVIDAKKGAYCDYLIKMDKGMVKIWFKTTKSKP